MSRVLVIDFETANSSAASACAIGAILVENNEIVQQYFSLIKPPSSSFQFTYIHGITWEQVKSAPTFREMWERDFGSLYQSVDLVVAHNIGFDSRVLKATADHHGINLPAKPTECTVKISRNQLKITPAKLDNVCQLLNIPLKHHEALSDSLASAHIYIYSKTGRKPWLGEKQNSIQYELIVEDTPITQLPKAAKTKEERAQEWAEAISEMNSEKSKALLATLLKK